MLTLTSAPAAVYSGNPSNYRTLLAALQPGDTLNLAAGDYSLLPVSNLRGTASAWITIAGPSSGAPAHITGTTTSNTVEISNCSYVAIQNLTIDSLSLPGVFGVSAKDGTNNLTHDILITNNTFVGQNSDQQTVAISTKTPTWNWTIRGNTINGAGTGLYLGNSDGTMPFVAGVIENNLVENTIGYNMEIKWQLPRPAVAGMPTTASRTLIRNNVFIKNDQPSPDGDRPNLLVGGFPDSGAGSLDMYEIYGNFFYHNPREALFQGSGRVSVHDNVFVDSYSAAIVLQNQDLPLKVGYVYNNTIYTQNRGIYFGTAAAVDDAVTGNLVLAGTPIGGSITNSSNNLTDTFANAALYANAPSFTPGLMNFYPRTGAAQGAAIDLTKFLSDTGYATDFNGTSKTATKGSIVYRGAYAGDGANPGWQLQVGIKPSGTTQAPPPPPASVLTAVQCSPTSLTSGQTSNCSVTVTPAASAITSIALSSSNAALTAPASATVAVGATGGSFVVTAGAVSAVQSATLTATLNGATAAATLTLNPSITPPPQSGQTFYLKADASEVSGTANGSVITPSVGPSGFTGKVAQNGSGSVNFAAGQSGNGVYFLNCCANYNNAYYKFTGSAVGSIFSATQGQVTFYLKSRSTWAQRQASGSPRAAFHLRDGNGTDRMYFQVQPISGYLGLVTNLWGAVQYYLVPKGTEDALFGAGVTLKVALAWNGGTGQLYLNDGLVSTFGYTTASPNWSAASNLDIGAYEYASYGGYYTLDDIIDEFTVSGGGTTAAGPVISSVSGATASGATITWTTDKVSDSQVNYGTTASYGSASPVNSALVTSHAVTLSGLAASTTYHYQVLSRDSSGTLTASGDYTFTTSSSGSGGATLQLHLDASEVSGTANGSVVTPSVGPSGFTGKVAQNGSGSVNFAAGQSGNGVYFLNCCANYNNAYYKFTGSGVGSIFSTAQGQVTFYLKSRYTWAQRQASGSPRAAFHVRDGSGTDEMYLEVQPVGGYLGLVTKLWGTVQYYYAPKGTEDTLYGNGVTLKVTMSWNGGTGKLYLNDGLVSTFGYTTTSPNWSAASNLDIGAYEYGSYGGYYTLDDIIDEFTVSPIGQ